MVQQLPDVSKWLVTPSNPPRQLGRLHYERCSILHNYILQVAWIGSGRSFETLPRRSWIDVHGDAAQAHRSKLEQSVIAFLERAYDTDWTQHKFFYWVRGLSLPDNPDQLWEIHDPDLAEQGDDCRFLTLYPANIEFAGEPGGLVYDQKEHKAIIQMDMMDEEITRAEDGPPWTSLEAILSAWIDMIHVGKITAAPKGVKLDNEKQDPWINHRYSIRQVEDTARAFGILVDAIESRMPGSSLLEATTSPLLEKSTLDSANIPDGCFARSFILKARRPRCSRIAPGLKIPTPESFASTQSFVSVRNDDEDRVPIPPVLIFQAANEETYHLTDDEKPFNAPYDSIEMFPAGLYFTDVNLADPHLAEEGFKLILPFAIGQNEHARKSDGSKFNNAWELYQHGYASFGGDQRPQRLVKLFKNWLSMVESGYWEVGQDGVAGQLEKLRESDTEIWQRYWIAPSW